MFNYSYYIIEAYHKTLITPDIQTPYPVSL